MRVSIEHNSGSSGLIFKKHFIRVAVTVVFSEEEQAIIRSRKLKDYVVLKREPDMLTVERLGARDAAQFAETYHLRIKDLASGKPDTYPFDTPIEAKQYETDLTAALKTLKEFISGNADTAKAKTFEL